MSHFAIAYTKLFGDALPLLEGDPAAKAAVNRWAFNAEDWAQAIAIRSAL